MNSAHSGKHLSSFGAETELTQSLERVGELQFLTAAIAVTPRRAELALKGEERL